MYKWIFLFIILYSCSPNILLDNKVTKLLFHKNQKYDSNERFNTPVDSEDQKEKENDQEKNPDPINPIDPNMYPPNLMQISKKLKSMLEADFDDQTIGNFKVREYCCDHSISFEEFQGKDVLKVHLKENDAITSSSKRSELARSTKGHTLLGQYYWYYFKFYLPVNYEEDRAPEIIGQWHGTPDKDIGEPYRSPPLDFRLQNDRFEICQRWDSRKKSDKTPQGKRCEDIGKAKKNQWYEWIVQVKWSYQNDGILNIWLNRELIYSKENKPNTYNDDIGPYFKIGVYKWPWHETGGVKPYPHIKSRTLYWDDVFIFEGNYPKP